MFERIRLVSFDLDDTLWPTRPVILAAEQILYQWLAQQAPRIVRDLSIMDMRDRRLAFMQQYPDIAHDLTLVRRRSLELLLVEYGYDGRLAETGTRLFRQARNRVTPWADVLPVLQGLRENYLLVSLSNGNAQVEQTPLAGCFHLDLNAAEVGAAKPHPAMFEALADWSGLNFAQMMHVGDDLQHDMLPARDLGMATAWVHRWNLLASKKFRPDLCLFNLHPLLRYLRQR
ncbi:HAD family hydrolase [Thiolapillus sp.]